MPGENPRFAAGEIVGGAFEITSFLGAGGMGAVYEARDIRLNRLVALKFPLDAECAHKLRLEAQGLAAVRHPNLVTVHALGHHEGTEFMVMELLHGATLEQRVEEANRSGRRLPLDEVLGLLIGVADALTAVHGAGVAHRDVKLSNVIVAGTRVVLTDFGLVTPEFELSNPSGSLAGSLDYMAPELIRGHVEPGQGPMVDLYALGVAAFVLLAGEAPFAEDDPQKIFLSHLAAPVPDVRSLRGDAPAELAHLVRELMAKSPDDRPESAEVVLWQLKAIRAALAIAPDPEPMRVLIVDDDPEVCSILKRNLQAALPRLVVETAADAEQALGIVDKRRPDLVLADLNMPRVNGVELCMRLLALPEGSRPVVIAMSAEAGEGDLFVLASLGVTRFVPKDRRFVARVCDAIGELRRARGSAPPPSRKPSSRPLNRPRGTGA